MPREDAKGFNALLKSAGALAVSRQLGAAVFMFAVLVLPRLAPASVVDQFLWAYFATLFLSSILNLGLERVVGALMAKRPRGDASAVKPVLRARLLSLPLTIASLWLLFRVVDVTLPAPAWVFSFVWVAAVQVEGVALAGLRAAQRHSVEPWLAISLRMAQAIALVGLAMAGVGITALVGAMAVTEVAGALLALVALSGSESAPELSIKELPWTTMALYTGVEVLAFAYLRIDVVLVGHVLGPEPGATYSLVYRVVDGLTGIVTPLLLLLFPYAARLVSTPDSLTEVRRRALRVVPAITVVLVLGTLFGSSLLVAAFPRMEAGLTALRLLVVAVPLYVFSAIELHVRSAEGRNREVLCIGAVVLMTNIVLNLLLIPAAGLTGAAVALVVTEVVQLSVVLATASERGWMVLRGGGTYLAYGALLAGVAVLLNGHRTGLAVAVALGALAVAAVQGLQTGFRSFVGQT